MKPMMSPSILSINFAYLTSNTEVISGSGIGWVHIDVMDDVSVLNVSSGFPVLRYMAKLAEKPLDVHLMIIQPGKFIPEVKALGACITSVHYEACPHFHRVMQQIREAGMLPVATINPAIPVAMLRNTIDDVYMVLVINVSPGFDGQKFIEHTTDKVRELHGLITVTDSEALIEADGNVNLETDAHLVAVGADALVTGNAIFSAPDLVGAIHALRNL